MPLNVVDWEPDDEEPGRDDGPRPWIGVLFECCGVYARVYRAATARRYEGRCPKCQARVQVSVGPDGTSARIFRAHL